MEQDYQEKSEAHRARKKKLLDQVAGLINDFAKEERSENDANVKQWYGYVKEEKYLHDNWIKGQAQVARGHAISYFDFAKEVNGLGEGVNDAIVQRETVISFFQRGVSSSVGTGCSRK